MSRDGKWTTRPVLLAAIARLHRREMDALVVRGDAIFDSVDSLRVFLPGAFNPLHDGHREMARVATASLGVPVAFELSIENVDKPPLDIKSIAERLSQFGNEQTICLTWAATFVQKVQLLGSVTFVVGVDTISRIAEARYYGDSASRRDRALEAIAAAGTTFLVFGRATGERFQTLRQLELPAPLRAICHEVGEAEFRQDISSTEIRRLKSPTE